MYNGKLIGNRIFLMHQFIQYLSGVCCLKVNEDDTYCQWQKDSNVQTVHEFSEGALSV